MTETSTTALILAAGSGTRFGGAKPKQLMDLCGRPVFSYALRQHVDAGHAVIVVVSAATRKPIVDYVADVVSEAGVIIATGGETRRRSLLAGIDAIPQDTPPRSAVLLRNSASPNTPIELVNKVAGGLETHDGVQAYVPSQGTAFRHSDGELQSLFDRSSTGITVDPTGYRLDLLRRIGERMRSEPDGQTSLDIALALGARIGIVQSPPSNLKITAPSDLDRLVSYMSDAGAAPLRTDGGD